MEWSLVLVGLAPGVAGSIHLLTTPRLLLCLRNDGIVLPSESVHKILDQAIRGVQHCLPQYQARTHRLRHRLRLDMGSHIATKLNSSLSVSAKGGVKDRRALTKMQVRYRWPILVRSWSNGANPHVLDTGMQSKDECTALPHLSRDRLCPVWKVGTPGVPVLRAGHQHTGRIATASRW